MNIFLEDLKISLEKKKINRRVWTDLFKVLISSDIILLVLDGRDPLGTWSKVIHQKIEMTKKTIILVINKCDLLPKWLIRYWIKIFGNEHLVIPFHSTGEKFSEKKSIFILINQIKKLNFQKKKNFIIGVVGFPNVGKSSLVNTLKGKKIMATNSIAGQTKVWQFAKLFKNIYIIDSPGIIPNLFTTESIKLFRGQIRLEKFSRNNFYLYWILKKLFKIANPRKFQGQKDIGHNFLKTKRQSIKKGGKLLKASEFLSVLGNYLDGKYPWFAPIPSREKKRYKVSKEIKWIYNCFFFIN